MDLEKGEATAEASDKRDSLENRHACKPDQLLPHKEFKIHGVINSNQGISYINIMRQIEAGLDGRHSEKDIIWAVIKSFHPSQQLKTYLEGNRNIRLGNLKKLLRTYFREKSSTELYGELTSASQGPHEAILDFMWRVLDLGQKVLLTSEDVPNEAHYDSRLVRQMTLKTPLTGLRDTNIATQLKDFILGFPSDEEIISIFNNIVSEGEERDKKFGQKKQIKSNAMSAETVEEEEITLKSLYTQMKELNIKIHEMKQNTVPTENKSEKHWRLCDDCRKENREKCEHCLICGSEEHFRAGCKKRRFQGKGQGSVSGARH